MIEISPLDVSNPLDRESRAIWSWAAADMTLAARTPQLVAFERDAAATVSDFAGTSYSVVPHQPAWHFVNEVPTLLLADNDLISWIFARHPSAMTGMVEFYHRAGINANGCIFYIGNNDFDGARLFIIFESGLYTLRHNNDGTEVSSQMASSPTDGQSVRLRFEVFADGSVRLHQSINGAAETHGAASDPNAFAAAWSADAGIPRLRLNSTGESNPGEASYRRGILLPGSGRTLAQLEAVY